MKKHMRDLFKDLEKVQKTNVNDDKGSNDIFLNKQPFNESENESVHRNITKDDINFMDSWVNFIKEKFEKDENISYNMFEKTMKLINEFEKEFKYKYFYNEIKLNPNYLDYHVVPIEKMNYVIKVYFLQNKLYLPFKYDYVKYMDLKCKYDEIIKIIKFKNRIKDAYMEQNSKHNPNKIYTSTSPFTYNCIKMTEKIKVKDMLNVIEGLKPISDIKFYDNVYNDYKKEMILNEFISTSLIIDTIKKFF